MQQRALVFLKSRQLVWLIAAVLLVVGVVAFNVSAGVPVPLGDDIGPWRYAASSVDCEENFPGSVCAEWPDQNSGTALVCCIPVASLGSYAIDSEACHTIIGRRPL